jgi:hypothetical protein
MKGRKREQKKKQNSPNPRSQSILSYCKFDDNDEYQNNTIESMIMID